MIQDAGHLKMHNLFLVFKKMVCKDIFEVTTLNNFFFHLKGGLNRWKGWLGIYM